MNISEIAAIIGAKASNNTVNIQYLLTDSRSLSFPETTLYFALRTQRNDGHKFIQELYNRQVRYFVVERLPEHAQEMEHALFMVVKNPLRALQKIATAHRHKFNIPVIGITGSNGKTIVKEWLYQLLRDNYQITRSPRSYNSQIGVPLSVWQISSDTGIGIFEAGISQTEEMHYLQEIVDPTIGIFTNIADAHQENFDTLQQKCAEKLRLFANAEIVIYNRDSNIIHTAVKAGSYPTFTWGTSAQAHVQIINTVKTDTVTRIEYKYLNKKSHFNIPFSDKASIENSMQCLCVLLQIGYSPEQVALKMLELENIAMRLEVKEGIQNCLIINDSYNSDLASLGIALDFLDQQSDSQARAKTIILSDILQNGQPENELYQTVSELLRNRQIDNMIGIGKQISNYKKLFEAFNAEFYDTTEDYIQQGAYRKLHNQIVLLKACRHFRFESISKHLEMIVHETILEVNLTALVSNLNYFRSKLKPTTKLMCMVKAFAYGSGSSEIARTLQHHGCHYLAVAVADEGAELRRDGIHIPIVVMDPCPNAFGTIFEYNLEPEIYSFKLLTEFVIAVNRQGITNYPIHIKIDSGMHRLGFEPDDIPALIEQLKTQQAVSVRSVFSHLAGADEEKFDAFTHQQIDLFGTCAQHLKEALPASFMQHILNSAGIERLPQYQYDMVRLGIGHYGISALPEQNMANVCSLKTVILQIKTVKAGESIGYSRKTMLTEDRKIAIVPIGYADGFDRKLGNSVGEVWVNNTRCKVLGNICMDLSMIDVTQADAKEGDQVEIFGENISISEVAQKIGTISYEVLTGISRRVKRVYFQE